jgi:hypothetical protein
MKSRFLVVAIAVGASILMLTTTVPSSAQPAATGKKAVRKQGVPRFPIEVNSGTTRFGDGTGARASVVINRDGTMVVKQRMFSSGPVGGHARTYVSLLDPSNKPLDIIVNQKTRALGKVAVSKRVYVNPFGVNRRTSTFRVPAQSLPKIRKVVIVVKDASKYKSTFLKELNKAFESLKGHVDQNGGWIAVVTLLFV